jgi:hypothetical protein
MSLDRAPRAVNGDESGSKFNRVAEVYIELQAFRCAWRGSQRVIRTLREPRDAKPWQVHEWTQNPGAGMPCPGRVKCHSGIAPWRRSRSATPRTIEMLCSGCDEVHFGGEVYGTLCLVHTSPQTEKVCCTIDGCCVGFVAGNIGENPPPTWSQRTSSRSHVWRIALPAPPHMHVQVCLLF